MFRREGRKAQVVLKIRHVIRPLCQRLPNILQQIMRLLMCLFMVCLTKIGGSQN